MSVKCSLLLVVVLLLTPAIALGQDHAAHTPPADAGSAWQWQTDANVFVGFNRQDRKFSDFNVWESQNWLMGTGTKAVGKHQLRLTGMLSFETFTMHAIGSPQVFQTGETFEGTALIDYQHPHDLVMQLGADFRMPIRNGAVLLGADVVGSPTIGPLSYMHRPSADGNPQAPLAHHHLDATHITPGVVRAGLEHQSFTFEGSLFQGREPDEDRRDIDLGALDSWAVRVRWGQGAWSAHAAMAWLTKPELVTPFDATRVTASIARTGPRLAWMFAFGQNREIHGNLEAYLLEGNWRWRARDTFYGRLESVAKDILDVGYHPVGTFHPHRQSQVGAATIGYLRELFRSELGAFSVGGDFTGYAVPANLNESYGSPMSLHVFVRYRLRPDQAHVH